MSGGGMSGGGMNGSAGKSGGMSGGGMSGGMSMSFNSHNLGTVLLFGSWMPETPLAFCLSCMAITLVAALSVAMSRLSQRLEMWMVNEAKYPTPLCNTILAVTTFVNQTLHFALMLLAMTFDISVFFAVVGGYAFGALLFGHLNQPSSVSSLAYRLTCAGAKNSGNEGIEVALTDRKAILNSPTSPGGCH